LRSHNFLIDAPLKTLQKLDGVHGLRGLAALAVVLFHLTHLNVLKAPSLAVTWFTPMYLSVQLFFVISAFTLTHSHTQSPLPIQHYLLRRLARIAPLFWIALVFYLVRAQQPDWIAGLLNFTFLFNLVPGYEASIVWAGWSIGVEMVFYVLLPLMWRFARSTTAWVCIVVITMIASDALWRATLGSTSLREHYAYFSIIGNLPQFAFGVLAYHVFIQYTSRKARPRLFGVIGFLSIAALAWVAAYPGAIPSAGIRMSVIGGLFAIICLWQATYPARYLRATWLQWIATRSYGIYLSHAPVIYYSKPVYDVFSAATDAPWLSLLISAIYTFAVVFFISHVSYRWIESPIMTYVSRRAQIGRA
jgi:peptidoglycan/LPS O-acetylase OafA/YrhL